MNHFNRLAAKRIALVSVLLALLVGPLIWHLSKRSAEHEVVSLAIEESNRFLRHVSAADFSSPERARAAAELLSGGLFDIAELYTADGQKLAESLTDFGERIEDQLPKHGKPQYAEANYESLQLTDAWVLRVFVPLRPPGSQQISAYFEGVRVIPEHQRKDIQTSAIEVAMITCLAALLCGAAIYPVIIHLSADNNRKTLEVLDSHIAMMEALGRAIAKRDSDTGAHNYRVAWIAARIGEEMGLAGSAMQSLIAGSFLHDVGKIGIPDAILLKPARLDDGEMATMRTHVQLGEDIVQGMGWLDGASEVVAGHHEKWDGSGYPRHQAGAAIPLSARIFAVADVFDALSSKRPYKEALPFDEVMHKLQADCDSHFDPNVIDVFRKIAPEIQDKLSDPSEQNARTLLESLIRKHFTT
ncbi:HD-GYP domain-containing protein [Massilia sp. TS11]|uniref:HD-GYP domain-containing protein n=1 Tax=Massilia sp. TS11 TaxID=2908003 RepID=UPI001EDB1E8D|nr:HD domain-containing phosphohydrolase [Massilia sp. TS11]MCG2584226.1 HD domain-containing protein [Massilia sp. TS11]